MNLGNGDAVKVIRVVQNVQVMCQLCVKIKSVMEIIAVLWLQVNVTLEPVGDLESAVSCLLIKREFV